MDMYLKNTKNINKSNGVIRKKVTNFLYTSFISLLLKIIVQSSFDSNSSKTAKNKTESNTVPLSESFVLKTKYGEEKISVKDRQKASFNKNDEDEEPEKVENSFAQFVEKYNAEKEKQKSNTLNADDDLSDDSVFEKSLGEDQEEGTLVYTEESLYGNDDENKEVQSNCFLVKNIYACFAFRI